jgi:hypothetical protein
MTETLRKRPACLEFAIGAVLAAIVDIWLAPLSCVVLVLSAQTAWWWAMPGWQCWQAPLCLIAALVWGEIAWRITERLCPLTGGFAGLGRRLITVSGFHVRCRRLLVPIAGFVGILLALPIRPAAVLWAALAALIVTYPRCGRASIYAVEVAVSALGLVTLVTCLLARVPAAWLDTACGAGLALSLIAICVAAAYRAARRVRAWSRMWWLIPAALPFVMVLDNGPRVFVFDLLAIVVAPGALLFAALLRHRVALSNCHGLVERQGLAKSLIGKDADGFREDAIRDGDDFFRLCRPVFRHWLPELTGDTGYLTWIGDDDVVLGDESVVFRATSLVASPLACSQDRCGRALASLVQELLPDLKLRSLEPLRHAFHHSWSVRRLTRRETPLGKMPWDDPSLVVVPVHWNGRFVYPAGSGIHDRHGYPCLARRIDIALSLRPETLQAVDRVAAGPLSASAGDVRLCQLLLWNARRILPGAYESLLTSLVELFRGETVALFMELEAGAAAGHGAAVCAAAREEFRGQLNERWARSMPAPLGTLIAPRITDLALDTYFDLGARARQFELRQKEHDHLFRLKHDHDAMRDCIQRYVLKGEVVHGPHREVATVADVRGTLVERLTRARAKIVKASGDAINQVNALNRGSDKDNSAERIAVMFGPVQKALADTARKFELDVDHHFRELQVTLAHLREISAETGHE